MSDLTKIWERTEYGRKEGHRLHMAAVLAERKAEGHRRPVKPVAHKAVTLVSLGFAPVKRAYCPECGGYYGESTSNCAACRR